MTSSHIASQWFIRLIKLGTRTTERFSLICKCYLGPYRFRWWGSGNKSWWESLATFATILKAFFACQSTEDDQHELVSTICYAVKLEEMRVQAFFYRLKEFNGYMKWLPGQELALEEAQLNLAFLMECQETGVYATRSWGNLNIPPCVLNYCIFLCPRT
jgi:hypothetical protein